MKVLKIIIIVGFILVLLFLSYTWIYSALTHNAFRPKVEISKKEKDFIKKTQDECDCELRYSYDVLIEDPDFFNNNNNIFFLELLSYNEYNNWCVQDSIFIKEKASTLIKDFISVSEYSHLLEKVSLVLIVYKDIGKDEKLIENICNKRIDYSIPKKEMKYIE